MTIESSSHIEVGPNSSSQEIFMTPDDFSSLIKKVDRFSLDPKTPDKGNFSFFQAQSEDDFNPIDPATWKKIEKKADRYIVYLNPNLSREDAPVVFIRLMSQIKRDIANRENPRTVSMSQADEERRRQVELEESGAREFYRIHPNLVDGALGELYTKLKA
jgi:hypothetical protein